MEHSLRTTSYARTKSLTTLDISFPPMTTTRPDGTPCGRQGGPYVEEERRECRNGGRFTDLSKCLRTVVGDPLQNCKVLLRNCRACVCIVRSANRCTPTMYVLRTYVCIRRFIHAGGGGGREMAHDFVGKGRRCHVRRLQARTTPCWLGEDHRARPQPRVPEKPTPR